MSCPWITPPCWWTAGPGSRYDSVVLDNGAAMAELVAHLQAQGYRRIGGLFGSTSTTAAERRDGYLAAMRAQGLEPDYREVAPAAEAAIAELGGWLANDTRPEAIVTSNSLLLMGALKAARTAGLRLPQDLALAGFDNERWTDLVEPGITVVEQPVEDMGRAAMSLLLERLSNPQLPIRRMVMTGRCVMRGSTGRASRVCRVDGARLSGAVGTTVMRSRPGALLRRGCFRNGFPDATQKPRHCRNAVHLRGAAFRLTGERVFDIFTDLGLDGRGRWSRKRRPTPDLSGDSRRPVPEIGCAVAMTINCTAMYWQAGLNRTSEGVLPKAIAAWLASRRMML